MTTNATSPEALKAWEDEQRMAKAVGITSLVLMPAASGILLVQNPPYDTQGMWWYSIMAFLYVLWTGSFLYSTRGNSRLIRLSTLLAATLWVAGTAWWNTSAGFDSFQFFISFVLGFFGTPVIMLVAQSALHPYPKTLSSGALTSDR